MKPNEIHSGGIQDPRFKIAEGSFPVILDPEPRQMNFIRFHSVSFGRVLDPRLLGKTPQQSWILDPTRMNFIRFHSGDPPEPTFSKWNEIRSGGIQDPRSKIAEGSFPVILDPEPRPNEFHSVSFGFIRASWIQNCCERPLSSLGSWIPPE